MAFLSKGSGGPLPGDLTSNAALLCSRPSKILKDNKGVIVIQSLTEETKRRPTFVLIFLQQLRLISNQEWSTRQYCSKFSNTNTTLPSKNWSKALTYETRPRLLLAADMTKSVDKKLVTQTVTRAG